MFVSDLMELWTAYKNSTSIDATCKNSDSSVNQDILVATIVKTGGDVEVVLYGAFTGSCTLRR